MAGCDLTAGPGNCRAVRFHRHEAIVDLRTGDARIQKIALLNFRRPRLEENARCKVFDSILADLFQLTTDPDDMARHLFEMMGYLMLPSEAMRFRWVLWGPRWGGIRELLNIVDLVAEVRSMASVTAEGPSAPARRVFSDEELENTMVIPFPGVFNRPVNEPQFPVYRWDIAAGELPGIAWKAFCGLRRLLVRGRFNEPRDCVTARADYFRAVDIVGSFLADCTVLIDDDAVRIPARDMWDRFVAWQGAGRPPIKMKMFEADVCSRGIRMEYTVRKQFCGIAFRS